MSRRTNRDIKPAEIPVDCALFRDPETKRMMSAILENIYYLRDKIGASTASGGGGNRFQRTESLRSFEYTLSTTDDTVAIRAGYIRVVIGKTWECSPRIVRIFGTLEQPTYVYAEVVPSSNVAITKTTSIFPESLTDLWCFPLYAMYLDDGLPKLIHDYRDDITLMRPL